MKSLWVDFPALRGHSTAINSPQLRKTQNNPALFLTQTKGDIFLWCRREYQTHYSGPLGGATNTAEHVARCVRPHVWASWNPAVLRSCRLSATSYSSPAGHKAPSVRRKVRLSLYRNLRREIALCLPLSYPPLSFFHIAAVKCPWPSGSAQRFDRAS